MSELQRRGEDGVPELLKGIWSHAAFMAAPDAVIFLGDDGVLLAWNRAAELMFGYERAHAAGMKLESLVVGGIELEHWDRQLRGCAVPQERQSAGERCEMSCRRADGTVFPAEAYVSRVAGADPVVFVGFIRDASDRLEAEQRLQAKELTLLEAQRIGRTGSWEENLKTGELVWSDETYRIFGQRKESFRPSRDTFYAVVHPLDRPRLQEAVHAARSGRHSLRIEHRILLPDGSQRIVCERAEFVPGQPGHSGRLVGTVQDVTDLKKAEEAVRASQRLYSSLVESLPQSIFRKDRSHRFTFANTRFCEAVGHRLEDIIGRTDYDFFPADLSAKYQADDRKVMSSGQTLDTVEKFSLVSGEVSYVQVIKMPLHDPLGKVIGIQGIFWDVTERKRMEEALQKREEHFRSLIENSSDLIAIISSQLVIGYVSESVHRILEYAPKALAGRLVSDFIHPDDASRVVQGLRLALKREGIFDPMQFRFRHARHSWRTFEAVGKRYVDESQRATLVINARDVTERCQLEDQLRQAQKMESIGQLAGGVAHDFNNILTVIQGHAALLESSEALGEAQRTSLQQVALAADRAANLTRQLLTFSRKQMMQPKHLDLNEVVSNTSRMLQRLLGEDISLHVHFAPNMPTVLADQGMLEQLLMNLAVNSRDAMPNGGQLIINTAARQIDAEYVEKHHEASLGLYVCVSVADTGAGIAPEDKAHIFEPFFTTKDVGKGTGLGLATVYGIIRQHQGWVTVDSELNKGSVFEIFLPVSSGGRKLEESPDEPVLRGGHETILVVEDEAPVGAMVRSILQRYGYRVLDAESGRTALEVWSTHRHDIDLVITDMVMPDGMTGRELGQRLKSDCPGLRILYSSGYSRETVGEDFFRQEGLHFLQKPYHPRKLVELVRRCLDEPSKPGCSSKPRA